MKSAMRPSIVLAKYQESRIRHFHRILDSKMSAE